MFIYSLRASTLKFFGVTTAALVALVTLVFFIPASPGTAAVSGNVGVVESVRYDRIKTAEDRLDFLRSFGWEVDPTPVEEVEVTIPAEVDKPFQSYNELQKQQGFDLTKYHKKQVTRYTYKITDYPDYSGDVYASILIFRHRVIAADICSADSNGFIRGLS